jgi:hypothetical protein
MTIVKLTSFIALFSLSSHSLAADNIVAENPWLSIFIAAISGAALVTSLWAMLLGRRSMKKDREFVTVLKKTIVKDQKHIDKSLRAIKTSEERAEKLVEKLVHQSNSLMSKQHGAWTSSEKIQELAESAEEAETNLRHKGYILERRIEQTQDIWDRRLGETENTVIKVEQELREGLNNLDVGIKRVQQQDAHSYQLAQHITAQHNIQLDNLDANNSLAEDVRNSLNKTLTESSSLLEQLQAHKNKADDAYKLYLENIDANENDLYTQYDAAFQNADMARQELNANVDESRLHVESLRRYEEQSRYIKDTTESNLKQLDIKSINQLADTLDTTQQTFEALSRKVSEAQQALNGLNQANLTSNSEDESSSNETRYYQDAAGSDTTLVSFFTSRKQAEMKD